MNGSLHRVQPDADHELAPASDVAMRLLAAREHSRYELARKLRTRGYHDDAIDEALGRLQSEGLLSDERFARSLIEQRVRKGYGPLRIRADLAEKGVSSELAGSALEQAGVDWQEALQTVAARRFGNDDESLDHRAMARRGRQLTQRGFPSGMVYRYLEQLRRG